MASKPRRGSKELSPDRSELMDKLIKLASSFISKFANNEQKIRPIIREFREIADEVRKMQKRTDEANRVGTEVLEVTARGMPFGSLAGGAAVAALAVAAGRAVAVLAVAVASGRARVAGGAASGILVAGVKSGSVNKVEELGKDLMEIVEPLKKDLDEIKRTCEELEQRSAELQAELTLTDMEEFLILTVVSILGRSDGIFSDMWECLQTYCDP
ncbi:uncharacterized protein LOC116062356 [Sander lucioperca]|uniref:uncharacterized protein LOC116062356 n=1 Tax=Sander lucioperca TaxID=283035 RepID=UPI00125DA0FE|nr:uncharacterized protein LOC116062356 [Sander lucioperca]